MDFNTSFRFLKLNKLQAYTLKREVAESSTKYIEKKDSFVGTVPLREELFDSLIIFFERQKISIDECDIFVSVFSEKDSEVVDIPFTVNKMLKYINCKLVFSYTALEE